MITVAAVCFVLGSIVGARIGLRIAYRRAAEARVDDVEKAFARGKRVGADNLIDQMIRHAFELEDEVDAGWPTRPRRDRRPS